MDTTSKVALVTGATSGIGASAAAALVDGGFTVCGTGRDRRMVTITGLRALEMDVTDETSMRRAVDTVVDAHGAVDVLVNNVGFYLSGFLEDLPLSEVRGQFETNVFGLLRMAQLVLPAMRQQRAGGSSTSVPSVGSSPPPVPARTTRRRSRSIRPRTILTAATTGRPRTRYRPGLSAKATRIARRLTPDRAWDRIAIAQAG